jgi:ribosomal protein L21E
MTKALLRIYVLAAIPCPCCMSMSMPHLYVDVHLNTSINAGMPDSLASGQSCTGLKKTTDAKTVSVQD